MNLNKLIIVKPYIRPDYTNADGTNFIYIRTTFHNSISFISTGIKVFKRNFSKKGYILTAEYDFGQKNLQLKKLITKAQSIIDKYFFENKILTKEVFLKEFFSNHNKKFFEFAFDFLEKMEIANITIKKYKSTLNLFEKYTVDILISDLNSNIFENYRLNCINKNQNSNTTKKTLSILNFLFQKL